MADKSDNGAVRIDPLYDIKTVARMFGVHQNTVYELIRQGGIEALRVGKRAIRIPETSVLNYLASQKIDYLQEEVEK